MSELQLVFLLLLVLAALVGCSEEMVHSTLPDAHPQEWMAQESENFHGKVSQSSGVASCIECHGADFDGGRSRVSCVDCHAHVEGFCVACHGGLENQSGAPPYSLRGTTVTTSRGVGAHTVHLDGGDLSAGFECTMCHDVPAFTLQEGHYDSLSTTGYLFTDSIAEIAWGDFAGTESHWSHASATCSNTYCHGNFTGGNSDNAVVWNGSNQAVCGSCHDIGTEPASLGWKHAYHVGVAGLGCDECHAGVVDAATSIVDKSLHVNGNVDQSVRDTTLCQSCHGSGTASCTTCHGGTDNSSGAPPRGLRGESSTTSLAVGAHTVHLEGGSLADGFACSECHVVPAETLAPDHLGADSIAEIRWGSLSGGLGYWNRSTGECSNIYCHGNFPGGYTTNGPVWTSNGGGQCGTCHDDGTRPRDLSGAHDKHVRDLGIQCHRCHASVVNGSSVIADPSLHVDGTIQVVFSVGNGTYSNRICSGMGCHGPEDWYHN